MATVREKNEGASNQGQVDGEAHEEQEAENVPQEEGHTSDDELRCGTAHRCQNDSVLQDLGLQGGCVHETPAYFSHVQGPCMVGTSV